MDSILESYRDQWEQLIKPDDYKYHESELEPTELELDGSHKLVREDFTIFNTKGKKIQCSLYRHSKQDKSLIIYSHGHSGNRAEGAYLVEHVCSKFSLLVFDYTGYGYSDVDHCTLGLKEMDDLECIVEHARHALKFELIFVWGRSMGAVTALLLAHRSRSTLVDGLLLDSPFSSTKEMLCNVMENVPNFVLHMIFGPLGKKLTEETGHDIMSIDLKPLLPDLRVPAMFTIAHGDILAGVTNLQSLFDCYGSAQHGVKKSLYKFDGDHASKRPDSFFANGLSFFVDLEAELSQNMVNRGMDHHFEAHRYIAAVHKEDSVSRLKKEGKLIDSDELGNSMAELLEEGQPFRVRASPTDAMQLAVKGDRDILESPNIDLTSVIQIQLKQDESKGKFSHSRFAEFFH